MRRTKIVCTIGKQTLKDNIEASLTSLVDAGMNVLRMNMSYAGGTYDMEKSIIRWARNHGYRIHNQNIAIVADLQGIKYRIRGIPNKSVVLTSSQEVYLINEENITKDRPFDVPNDAILLPMPPELYQNLCKNIKLSEECLKIYLGDGDIILTTDFLNPDHSWVRCNVLVGGLLKEGKGITLQGIDVTPVDSLTDKDKEDLKFLVQYGGATFVALSFVQSGEDIRRLRRFMIDEAGCNPDDVPPIIAKIETKRGYQNLEDILDEAYGIMVARGDLGLQVGVEQVTEIQKEIIQRCLIRAKPVITATQMLESMENSLEPKRAEASDIFNAILDGTDAVMLSGETSAGKYPVEAVKMMSKIVTAAESYLVKRYNSQPTLYSNRIQELQTEIVRRDESSASRNQLISHLISHSAAIFASTSQLQFKAIVAPTTSGSTCRLISRYRPPIVILAAAHKLEVVHRLALSYGVVPIYIREVPTSSVEQIFSIALRQASRRKLVSSGDLVVFSGGYPMWQRGTTNLLKIHTVTREEVIIPRDDLDNL